MPRVINVDGHPAYARAIAELKHLGGGSKPAGSVANTVEPIWYGVA